ncbi:hypothetical protein D3C73_595920 [compost metagenome]
MKNVHEAITNHSTKQHLHLVRFSELDELREQAIEAAVTLCKNNEPFSVDSINQITSLINAHAKEGISPLRKQVTIDMVRQFVDSQASNEKQ